MSNLEPIAPAEAVEMYIDDKKQESSEYTVQSHRSRLSFFVEWCSDEAEIENLNNLTGRDCQRYRSWRRELEDPNTGETPNPVTMKSSMDTLRVWAKWAVAYDAIEEGIPDKILSPTLSKHENERDDMLDAEVGEAIREHLDRFEHASREHVVFELIWRGLLRRGTIRSIDLDDVHLDEETPHIEIRHRPDTGTPLKKKADGERWISLQPGTAQVLKDYIEHTRPGGTHSTDRKPLFRTEQGRPHVSTIQAHAYAATRPCKVTGECPHDREIDECDAASNRNKAYACPSSKSPHAIRRGAITRALASDIPETAVAQRSNTAPGTLEKHYDRRTSETRMNQRREYFDEF